MDQAHSPHRASPIKATLYKTASLNCVVPTCRVLMASLLPSTPPIAYKGYHSWRSFSKTKQRLCHVCNGWHLSAKSQRRSLHCSGNLPQRFCRILQCTAPVDLVPVNLRYCRNASTCLLRCQATHHVMHDACQHLFSCHLPFCFSFHPEAKG